MTKPIDRNPIYRRRAFDADTIELCCRWYATYRLSYRDLAAIMAERGVNPMGQLDSRAGGERRMIASIAGKRAQQSLTWPELADSN